MIHLFENRVAHNPVLVGVGDVASAIISHDQSIKPSQMFSICVCCIYKGVPFSYNSCKLNDLLRNNIAFYFTDICVS